MNRIGHKTGFPVIAALSDRNCTMRPRFVVLLKDEVDKTMVKITKVKVLQGYHLELAFNDGVCGVVDLSGLVGTGVFALWRDRHFFEQVRIGSIGELTWSDQIDLCPDSLYLRATGKSPEEVFPTLRREAAYA
jgi:hypothetical protein